MGRLWRAVDLGGTGGADFGGGTVGAAGDGVGDQGGVGGAEGAGHGGLRWGEFDGVVARIRMGCNAAESVLFFGCPHGDGGSIS